MKRDVVDRCYEAVKQCDSLVVVGSSLTVFSSFRFVKRAKEAGKKILIVNEGETRADEMCCLKVENDISVVLKGLDELM